MLAKFGRLCWQQQQQKCWHQKLLLRLLEATIQLLLWFKAEHFPGLPSLCIEQWLPRIVLLSRKLPSKDKLGSNCWRVFQVFLLVLSCTIQDKFYNDGLVVNIQFYKDGKLVSARRISVGCPSGFCKQLRCVVEARAEAALASSQQQQQQQHK